MKWIALHGNDVVGEFKNAKDAETYKAAADRAAFKVNIVSVDDDEFACYIRLVGLYGMPDHTAFYRKNGDCFDFCSDIAYATMFPDGRSNPEVQKILENSEWYCEQYNADRLEAVPCYVKTQQKPSQSAQILTVGFFLSVVQGILKPNPGTEFYHANAECRMEAFTAFWTRVQVQLRDEHCRVWQLVDRVLKAYQDKPATNEVLQEMNEEIQKDCSYFEDEPPHGIKEGVKI